MDTLSTRSRQHDWDWTPVTLAVLHAVLFIASLVVIPLLAPSARIPNPFGPDDPSRRFFLENAAAIRWSDWLQLLSAVCLAALGCVWPHPRGSDRGARTLTLVGGVGAAALMALAALTSWALASPEAVDPGSAFRALQFLPFLLGGPGWAAFFTLFLMGATRTGVGVLPRAAVWTGYGLSATSALATLVLITLAAAPFLPLTRFLGFLWLIVASVLFRKSAAVQG